jgi:hypothetical protein
VAWIVLGVLALVAVLLLARIPTALIAGLFGFRTRECFRAPGEEHGPVAVRF